MNKPRTNNPWIRPLPEKLINKIAAGEVIERPSAVLKELVENSLDAGASKIEVIVEKSGTKLITVIDNGCGINADQIEIAFSRHATSKISNFEDLEELRSFGFRGEALPSISSVSKLHIITKTRDDDTGTEMIIEGGVIQSKKPVAAPLGTKIEVRDLFFNTPARRKFLKTETTEARYLTRNAVAMALSADNVNFSYTLNGRKVFRLDDNQIDLKQRVRDVLMGSRDNRLIDIESESEFMRIQGHLSLPDNLRQNQYSLYIFINNRYIKSQTLVHAITAGYKELLPRSNYPLGAVFLHIDPSRVDVNVHPTKAEVRLSDERKVHDLLYQAVKKAVFSTSGVNSPSIRFAEENNHPGITKDEALKRLKAMEAKEGNQRNSSFVSELYTRTDRKADRQFTNTQFHKESNYTDIDDYKESDSEIDKSEGVVFLGALSELYLIFKKRDELMIIDQHTAHERVLYEENMKLMDDGAAVSQNLLFPINIDLTPDRYALYEEARDILSRAGFSAEPFGSGTVMLSAVPISISKKSPEKIFNAILEDVENLQKEGEDLKKAVAQSMACRAAVMAGDRLSPDEAKALYKKLMVADNKYSCPHGRPIILKLKKDELDARFGRK